MADRGAVARQGTAHTSAVVGVLVIALSFAATASVAAQEPAPPSELSTILGRYHDVLEQHYRTTEPMSIVRYLSERWRLRGGGNVGYDESLDMVLEYLRDAGLERAGRIEVLEGPLTLRPLAWEPVAASVSLVEPNREQLHTYDDLPTIWGKYSGSTPPGGVTAALVDVGAGEDAADYADIDVRGKIVLGSGSLSRMFEHAVEMRGAAGVISDWLPDESYHTAYPGIVRYQALPFGEPEAMRQRTGWGLKLPRQTTDRLRGLLRDGRVALNVTVETRFFDASLRELVVEIPGAVAPEERIVLVAHLDNNKPGANNNASGVAGHAELAAAIVNAIERGTLEPPARTLTFLFGAERNGTRLWLERTGDALGGVIAAINGDMTGENVAVTGGVYRLERSPDPAVSSPRPEAYTAPEDRHSGWPVSELGIAHYPGHFLNQLMWAAVSERTRRVDWEVIQHPFEGGSDHDVLLPLGTPTALSWHWVDHFISTNFDTPDKVSNLEMENVALSHGMAALLMASGTVEQARALLAELERAALARLSGEIEATNSLLADLERGPVEGVDEPTVAERLPIEEALLHDWARWYDEALVSVRDLPVSDDAGSLDGAIDSARVRVSTEADVLEPARPTTSIVVTDTVHHTDVQNCEPMVAELADGALLVTGFPRLPHIPARPPSLWKSADGGRLWERVNVGEPQQGAVGNSDTDLAVARDGTIYFVSMGYDRTSSEGTHITIGVSRDNARSWSWTYLARNRMVDRPWVEVAPDGTAHVIWNDGDGVYHVVSTDGGLTWEDRPKINARGGSSHLAVGPNGEVAVRITPISASGSRYDAGVDFLAVSTDRGRTWTRNALPGALDWEYTGPDAVPRWVEPLAWDVDGSLYHLWSEGREMWLGRSTDHGATWSTWRIARDDDVVFYPYLVARGSGELVATWFSSAHGKSVRVAVIETGEVGSDGQPRVVLSEPLRFESWMVSDGEWMRDTAGEYVPVVYLKDGDIGVVTPLQDARVNRFGFSWWRLELR